MHRTEESPARSLQFIDMARDRLCRSGRVDAGFLPQLLKVAVLLASLLAVSSADRSHVPLRVEVRRLSCDVLLVCQLPVAAEFSDDWRCRVDYTSDPLHRINLFSDVSDYRRGSDDVAIVKLTGSLRPNATYSFQAFAETERSGPGLWHEVRGEFATPRHCCDMARLNLPGTSNVNLRRQVDPRCVDSAPTSVQSAVFLSSVPATKGVLCLADTYPAPRAWLVCDAGHTVSSTGRGVAEVACGSDGSWSGDRVFCSELRMKSGMEKNMLKKRSSDCDINDIGADSSTSSSPADPRCTSAPSSNETVTYTSSVSLNNGAGVLCIAGPSGGSRALVVCNAGYTAIGTDNDRVEIVCEADGNWSGNTGCLKLPGKNMMRNFVIITALSIGGCFVIAAVAITCILLRMWMKDPRRLRGSYYPQELEKKKRNLRSLDRDDIQVMSNTFQHSASFTYKNTPFFTYD